MWYIIGIYGICCIIILDIKGRKFNGFVFKNLNKG